MVRETMANAQLGADALADREARRVMDGVPGEVELAALPCRAAQHRPAGGAQAGVIVRDDILHASQAARLQALQECAPMDLRLGEGDRDAQHPTALVGADADRREHGGVADDPAVAHLLVAGVEDHRGCSDTDMRIALMERYLANFPATTIRLLLADREFVGASWMDFLCKNNIPFAIRVRDNLRIATEDGHDLTVRARLRQARRGRTFRARLGTREDAAASNAPLLNVAAKPLKGEWLIVVTNVAPRTAIETYRGSYTGSRREAGCARLPARHPEASPPG
jgi:hypothetical protein